VDIYLGDPANGCIKLPGSGIVPLILAGGFVDGRQSSVLATEGLKQIYVLADPQTLLSKVQQLSHQIS
jgi:hypothetical protein